MNTDKKTLSVFSLKFERSLEGHETDWLERRKIWNSVVFYNYLQVAVMAADSAVTVRNHKGVKIYNTATKIFSLSDEHPIGVMIYDNVEFMVKGEVLEQLEKEEIDLE